MDQAVTSALEAKLHWGKRFDFEAGARQPTPETPSFGSALGIVTASATHLRRLRIRRRRAARAAM